MVKTGEFVIVSKALDSPRLLRGIVKDMINKKLSFGIVKQKHKFMVVRRPTEPVSYLSLSGIRMLVSDRHNAWGVERKLIVRGHFPIYEWYDKGVLC